MVKVLVANENTEQTTNFCKYLQNDNALFTSSANSGIEALNKYNEINPHIFILDSHFKDMETTEIIDRLSSTVVEKRNSNIILTMDELKEQNNFLDVAKIYKFVEIPKLTQQLLYDTVKQMDNENKYDDFELDDKELEFLDLYDSLDEDSQKLIIETMKKINSKKAE